MSYAQYNLIEASDYNNLVGTNPTTDPNKLNTVWATGGGQAGYGQTAVTTVNVGDTVAAANWATLVNNTSNAASHQGSSITSVTAPVTGGVVTFIAAIPTNLTTIYTNRGNAASQGSTLSNTVATVSAWSDYANFQHQVNFANGDAARYFFNAGGQIKMTCSHPAGSGIDNAFNLLCAATGTVVMSGQNSGSRTIVGTSYNGITKIGGSGSPETLATDSGYFGLATGNTTIFDQNSGTSPYTSTVDVKYLARTNGPQGSNNDNGSIVFVNTVLDYTGANGPVSSGSSVTCTVVPPSTTYVANTWGTITISGSVSTG